MIDVRIVRVARTREGVGPAVWWLQVRALRDDPIHEHITTMQQTPMQRTKDSETASVVGGDVPMRA